MQKGGGSSSESLINDLKSKHRIHVTHANENYKNIPAQQEIRSQIVKKEICLFEATKGGPLNLKHCTMLYLQISPHEWNRRKLFHPWYYLSQNSETE